MREQPMSTRERVSERGLERANERTTNEYKGESK